MKYTRPKKGAVVETIKRGQTSLSNPMKTTHRQKAKTRMFTKQQGESMLTQAALVSHNKVLSEVNKSLVTLNLNPGDYRSEASTFKTFATNFTTCTLPAFDRFFENSDKESPMHLKMLSFIAAAEEKITQAELPESDTSYMFAFIECLKGVNDSEEDVAAGVAVIGRVITKVSNGFLQTKFAEYSKVLHDVFIKYQHSKNAIKLLPNLMGCLSTLLRSLRSEEWTYSSTMNLLKLILDYIVHDEKKLRKSANYNVSAVLKGSSFMPGAKRSQTTDTMDVEEPTKATKFIAHPASSFVANYVVEQIKKSRLSCNALTVLHLVEFLKMSLPLFPLKSLKEVFMEMINTMKVSDSQLNKASLRVWLGFMNYEEPTDMSQELHLKLMSELSNTDITVGALLIPSMLDGGHCKLWIQLMSECVRNLVQSSQQLGLQHLCLWIDQLWCYWKSSVEAVHKQVSESIEFLLRECIQPLDCSNGQHLPTVQSIISSIQKGMSLLCGDAWSYVFGTLGIAFHILGPQHPDPMGECLRDLTQLNNSVSKELTPAIDSAIGAAIQGLGPEKVLEIIPLQITADLLDDEKYFWILPLFERNIKRTRLEIFQRHFVKLALMCQTIVEKMVTADMGDSVRATTYKTIEVQIWSLLPPFTCGAVDSNEALKNVNFAKMLKQHLEERSDTRLFIMAGLRNLIASAAEIGPEAKIAAYAQNFMPSLLNVFLQPPHDVKDEKYKKQGITINPGHRFAAYETLKCYLTICPPALRLQYFSDLHKRYQKYMDEKDYFRQKSAFGLVKLFIPYLDHNQLQMVLTVIKQVIENKKEIEQQKICYRVLEAIIADPKLESFVAERLVEIFTMLLGAQTCTVSKAVGARLKCLSVMPAYIPDGYPAEQKIQLMGGFLEECIDNCGSSKSTPVKNAAMGLLRSITLAIQKIFEGDNEKTLKRLVEMLLPNLGEDDAMTSSTVIALTVLCYDMKDSLQSEVLQVLMAKIVPQMSKVRLVVKPCIAFVRAMFVVFPIPVMSDYVDVTVAAIMHMTEDCSSHFRLMIRYILSTLCRKFGSDRILALIPEARYVLRKVLRNVIKADSAKKRKSKQEDERKPKRVLGAGDSLQPASLDDILNEINNEIEEDHLEEENSSKTPKTILKKAVPNLYIREKEDEIVDFLDPTACEAFTNKKPKKVRIQSPQQAQNNAGFRTDKKTGKLIIEDSSDEEDELLAPRRKTDGLKGLNQLLGDDEDESKRKALGKRKRSEALDYDEDNNDSFEDEDDSEDEEPKFPSRPAVQRKKKPKFDYGSEFKAKKAFGDIKNKNGNDPYAYVPLNKARLNRRTKSQYAGQFKNVVPGAKKGAAKGAKAFKINQRKKKSHK